jgi:hypothetical protein
VYEDKGNWKDDKRHGKGGMKYADGAVYEGYDIGRMKSGMDGGK